MFIQRSALFLVAQYAHGIHVCARGCGVLMSDRGGRGHVTELLWAVPLHFGAEKRTLTSILCFRLLERRRRTLS